LHQPKGRGDIARSRGHGVGASEKANASWVVGFFTAIGLLLSHAAVVATILYLKLSR
jgi:hypothetical protein